MTPDDPDDPWTTLMTSWAKLPHVRPYRRPSLRWETQLCLVMRASVTNTALITFALALRRYRLSTLKGELELQNLVDKMLSIARIMSRVPTVNFRHVVAFFEYEATHVHLLLTSGTFAIWVSKTTVKLTLAFYALVGLYCVVRSWRLVPIPLLLVFVTSYGWIPVITSLSELLLGRLSFKTRQAAREAVQITFWVAMLRGLLVLAQGNLLAAVYGDYQAALFTYRSYFMVGDALDTLAEMLTFNFDGFFDFSVETEATMLSIVVWGVELVAVVGTSAPSRFQELMYRIARSISPRLGEAYRSAEQRATWVSGKFSDGLKGKKKKKKKKKQWDWKLHARLAGARLKPPKDQYEAWHAKVRDALANVEEELDPEYEAERPCTWCTHKDGRKRSKEDAWDEVQPNYPDGNEQAPLEKTKVADGRITDEAVQYLLWDERWPAWLENRDRQKRVPEPMAVPRYYKNRLPNGAPWERPDAILRFCEDQWNRRMGGKLGGRLVVTRIARVCQILDHSHPDDQLVDQGSVRSLSALSTDGGVPIAEAAQMLLSCMSDKSTEDRKQKAYEDRLDEIRERLYKLGLRKRPAGPARKLQQHHELLAQLSHKQMSEAVAPVGANLFSKRHSKVVPVASDANQLASCHSEVVPVALDGNEAEVDAPTMIDCTDGAGGGAVQESSAS